MAVRKLALGDTVWMVVQNEVKPVEVISKSIYEERGEPTSVHYEGEPLRTDQRVKIRISDVFRTKQRLLNSL